MARVADMESVVASNAYIVIMGGDLGLMKFMGPAHLGNIHS